MTKTTAVWVGSAYDPETSPCCCTPDRCSNVALVALYTDDQGTPGAPDWKFALLCSGAALPNAPGQIYSLVWLDNAQTKITLIPSVQADLDDYGWFVEFSGTIIAEDQVAGDDWWSGWQDIPSNDPTAVRVLVNGLAIDELGPSTEEQAVCLDSYA